MIISAILIALAAICNVYMDKLMIQYMNLPGYDKDKYHRWWTFDPLAKYKHRSYLGGKANNILLEKIGIKTTWLSTNCNDAWHFLKSLMIVLLVCAIVFFDGSKILNGWHIYIIVIGLLGLVWNLTFNFFYKIVKV